MKPKISLELLKSFVSEVESTLDLVNKAGEDPTKKNEYKIQLSKLAGLFSGVVLEGTMLVADAQQLILNEDSAQKNQKNSDFIGTLLSSIKGNGTN